MGSPFLAVTLDAKRRLDRTERALDLPRGRVHVGFLDLLEHVWERKDPHVNALVIAACFGPDERLPAALVTFGFLVPSGAEWDLEPDEVDRLLKTHKQRVEAGKARVAKARRTARGTLQRSTSEKTSETSGATSGQPAGAPAASQRPASEPPAANQLLHPAPSTQHQKKILRAADAAPPGDPRVSGGDPTYRALVDALFAEFRELRGADYDPKGRDWKSLANLRAKFGAAEILRRWRIGLQATFKARCDTLVDLEERWNALTAPDAGRAVSGHQARRSGTDPNQGIITREEREETAAEIEEANRRNEEWLNGG